MKSTETIKPDDQSRGRCGTFGVPRTPVWVWWSGGLCILLGCAVLPLDGWVAGLFGSDGFQLRGDPRREIEAFQQFGQLSFTLLIAWAVWLLDPVRRRVLLDLLLAKAIMGVVILLSKATVGRARPSYGEPWLFAGPSGRVELHPGAAPVGVWSADDGFNAALASMPSGHTAHAVLVAVALGMWYPRLIPVVATLASIVGVARVLTGAHYPSDVLIGAALGLVLGGWMCSGYRGVRLLDAVWVRLVDRHASPAYPALRDRLRR